MKKKIYILTGPIQTGKTTRLFEFIKTKKNVAGILAPVVNGKRTLFNIVTKQLKILEIEKPDSSTITIGKYHFLKSTFDWANLKLMEGFNSEPEWLIVDEVGKLELKNEGLSKAITEIFKSGKNIKTKIVLVVRDSLLDKVVEYYNIKYEIINI